MDRRAATRGYNHSVAAKTFKARLGGAKGDVPTVEIPFDVKAEYGSARARVRVTVNGVVLRTTVAAMGGRSWRER